MLRTILTVMGTTALLAIGYAAGERNVTPITEAQASTDFTAMLNDVTEHMNMPPAKKGRK
jgi:hypothetical protein